MKRKINQSSVTPIISLFVIFIILSIFTKGRIISLYNLTAILDQSIPFIVGGLGMLFVIAQGSIDISQGAVVGIAGTMAAMLSNKLGVWVAFPSAIIAGAAVGAVNGYIVGRFKVASFLVGLAILIAVRGVVTLILNTGVIFATTDVLSINDLYLKIPIFIGLFLLAGYLFEFTKVGYFCKSIGENENACNFSGVPVIKYKVIAFMISGIMAGIAGLLIISRIGGASTSMGNFFEFQVLMAIYFGGVTVKGGVRTKVYKMLLGVITIVLLENGLVILGVGPEFYEAIEGIILLLVLFVQNRVEKDLSGLKSVC